MDAGMNDVGAYVKPVIGNVPVASAAATLNGSSIDRSGYHSCVLFAQSGAATGSPTAQTLDAKIQDSDDGSTGWADVTGAAITQNTAVNSSAKKSVNLQAVKRYTRVVATVAFTAGTSPTLGVSTAVVLGGARELPAT